MKKILVVLQKKEKYASLGLGYILGVLFILD